MPRDADIYVLGGGEDAKQTAAAQELRHDGGLAAAVARGAVVLGVCAGYQLLGEVFPGVGGAATEEVGDGPLEDLGRKAGGPWLFAQNRGKGPLDKPPREWEVGVGPDPEVLRELPREPLLHALAVHHDALGLGGTARRPPPRPSPDPGHAAEPSQMDLFEEGTEGLRD